MFLPVLIEHSTGAVMTEDEHDEWVKQQYRNFRIPHNDSLLVLCEEFGYNLRKRGSIRPEEFAEDIIAYADDSEGETHICFLTYCRKDHVPLIYKEISDFVSRITEGIEKWNYRVELKYVDDDGCDPRSLGDRIVLWCRKPNEEKQQEIRNELTQKENRLLSLTTGNNGDM